VTLEVAKGVEIKVSRDAIAGALTKEGVPESDKSEAKKSAAEASRDAECLQCAGAMTRLHVQPGDAAFLLAVPLCRLNMDDTEPLAPLTGAAVGFSGGGDRYRADSVPFGSPSGGDGQGG